MRNVEPTAAAAQRGFTERQITTIARLNLIEGLTYSETDGVSCPQSMMSLSAVLSYALAIWHGQGSELALEQACYSQIESNGVDWLNRMLATTQEQAAPGKDLKTTQEWLLLKMSSKTAVWITNSFLANSSALTHVTNLLGGNVVTSVITTLVLTTADFKRLFEGRISTAQIVKNITTTASTVVGSAGGWIAGAASGAVIGSTIPGLGTAIGAVLGGLLGSVASGTAVASAVTALLDDFIEDDAKAMLKIIEQNFIELAADYLLAETEAEAVIALFQSHDLPNLLRDMHASDNRDSYARQLLASWIEETVKKRQRIVLPSDAAIFQKTDSILHEWAAG